MSKGVVSAVYFGSCGSCGHEVNTCEAGKKSAMKYLREQLGWKHHHEFGWMCQGCVKHRESKIGAPIGNKGVKS